MLIHGISLEDRFAGCLLGGAIGDAMGLPYEGCAGPLVYHEPDAWQVSDDTQLTVATCKAIAREGRITPESIAREFVECYRRDGIHGVGASTLKALRDLDAGGHWALVGRRGEAAAGSGAAMRVAPLGLMIDPRRRENRILLRDICRITHHNDEAYVGALAVVLAVYVSVFQKKRLTPRLLRKIAYELPDSNVKDRLESISLFIVENSIEACGDRFGSSGYVAETVPLALAAATFLSELGFQRAVEAVIECGGDTDTTASIVGQLGGAILGLNGLPECLATRTELHDVVQSLSEVICHQRQRPYSREELLLMPDDCFPERGNYCGKCLTWIPDFTELLPDEASRIRKSPMTEAMNEVQAITNCSPRWAKIWALHPNGPEPEPTKHGPPCPQCGEPLQTDFARQCLECGADWH